MKLEVTIMYPEGYLPTPRCRKLRLIKKCVSIHGKGQRDGKTKERNRSEVHPAEYKHGPGAAQTGNRLLPEGGQGDKLGDPAGPGQVS